LAQNPVTKALRGYDDDQLECRGLAHAWRVIGYFREPDGIVARDVVCDRCETERTDRWNRETGERQPARYRYATGYRIAAEGERVEGTAVRLETIRRADVFASESQMLDAMTGGNNRG
jgi:hypothetical protein